MTHDPLEKLRPSAKPRMMDLVQQAGIDVAQWAFSALRRKQGPLISHTYDDRRRGGGDCGQPAGLSKGLWASSASLSTRPGSLHGPLRVSVCPSAPRRAPWRVLGRGAQARDERGTGSGPCNPAKFLGPAFSEEPFFPPSNPWGPPPSVDLTLWLSMLPAVG